MADHTKPQGSQQPGQQAASSTPPRFIKMEEVRAITALSASEIYRRIAAGTFPAQIALGPRAVAWVEAEVVAWCNERMAERQGVAA